eukprot:3290106-Rhodomonas_salina.2
MQVGLAVLFCVNARCMTLTDDAADVRSRRMPTGVSDGCDGACLTDANVCRATPVATAQSKATCPRAPQRSRPHPAPHRRSPLQVSSPSVSYTHLRAHETEADL